MIILRTTFGNISLELDYYNTKITAENFLEYVRAGFYDGTLFHRVIDDFMIQGGGFTSGMKVKETRDPIKNEADKGGSNQRGTIAMARTSDPHSATSQFFINVKDNPFLDFRSKSDDGWGYCVFGKVVEGMDVVDKIKQAPTIIRAGYQDVPIEEVMIKEVIS